MTQVTPNLVSPSFHMETHTKGPLIEFIGVGVGGPLSKFGGDELAFVEFGVRSVAFIWSTKTMRSFTSACNLNLRMTKRVVCIKGCCVTSHRPETQESVCSRHAQ